MRIKPADTGWNKLLQGAIICFYSGPRAQMNINTLRPPVNSIPTMFKVIYCRVCRKMKPFILGLSWVAGPPWRSAEMLLVENLSEPFDGSNNSNCVKSKHDKELLWLFYILILITVIFFPSGTIYRAKITDCDSHVIFSEEKMLMNRAKNISPTSIIYGS